MIFLSASIPDSKLNSEYFSTAKISAIRDAVIALVSVVISRSSLTWGGHPSITSLVVNSARQSDILSRARVYQSEFFADRFPAENQSVDNVIITSKEEDEKSSLEKMRARMFHDRQFTAGIFIGGMKGVVNEYNLFRTSQPRALALCVARTGGAAKFIQGSSNPAPGEELLNDYGYIAYFEDMLRNRI